MLQSLKNRRNIIQRILMAFVGIVISQLTIGQTSTWTGATSATWLTAGNWSPSGAPSGTAAEAFFNNNTNAGTNGINMNGISTGNSSIGAVHWGASATTARTISNSAGSATGILTLNGITLNSLANTIIRNAGSGNHTIAASSPSLGLALGNATNNIIAIDGTGSITISSIISGTGRNLTKAGSGTGVLLLSGVNTYTGSTTITSGELRLNPSGNNSLSGSANFNGGTLATTGITASRTITFGSINLSDNSTLALGSNAHTITFTSLGTLTAGKVLTITGWSGASYLTGTTTGTGGKVFIGSSNTLTDAQLSQIRFYNGTNYFTARQLTTGELVPALNLVVTNPGNQTAGAPFSVTVTAKDYSGNTTNMVNATGITLTSTGSIGGTTTGTIAAGTSSVTISGVTIAAAGTGFTITATRSSGDQPITGTSGTFDVATAGAPVLVVSGTPTNHGSFCPGVSGSVVTYTITNNGTAASNVVVSSSDAQFVVSNLSSTSIGAGGTATYDVVFTPASAGAKSATISVFYNTSTLSTTSSLTGTGTTPVTQAVSSAAATGVTSAAATLNGNLTTLGVCPATTEKGFVYSVTSTNPAPAVGGSGVTKTTVSGVATGAYLLALSSLPSSTGYSFAAYAYDGSTYTYGSVLTFTTLGALSVSGTTAHGSTCPTVAATPQTYTITNSGSVTAAGISVVSSDPQFVVSGLSSTSIAGSGGTATYTVTFTPSGSGAQSAVITVSSTTGGIASVTSNLTGTGTTPVTPIVSSAAASTVTAAGAVLNGNVTTLGVCPATTQKGFVYAVTSTNADPLAGGTGVTTVPVGSPSTGAFTTTLSSLGNATGYSYKAYVFDGTSYTYGAVTNFTTLAAPVTTAASAITFTAVTTNSISLSWTNGSGANRIVVARATATTAVAPANATGYTANSASFVDGLNSATGTGNVVIFNGTGSSVTVTGLTTGTSYTFDIYEYNGTGVTANYGSAASGARTTLAAEPTVQATAVTFSNVSSTGFRINWTLGNGANSIVLVKDVTAVDSDPVDGTSYTANTAFGSGTQLGTGNYTVYRATLNNVTITGLTDGHTYHVAVYTYNGTAGSGQENYLITSPATGSQLATSPTYYSQGSLSPNTLANWNSVRGGGGSTPADFTTTANFVIQNGHTMTTSAGWTFGGTGSILEIENGGTLTATSAITVNSGATFKIDAGGTYNHSNTGAPSTTIFNGTENFAATSNFKLNNWASNTTAITTGVSLPYGNLEINWTGNTNNWQNAISGTVNLTAGDLVITSAGSGTFRFSAGTAYELTIGGNFSVTATAQVTFASTTSSSSVRNVYIGGNYNQASGTTVTTGSSSPVILNFTGTGKTFTNAGTLTSTDINYVVANGASLTLSNGLVVATTRTATLNGTLITGTNVISGAGTVVVNATGTLKVGSLNAGGAIAGNVTATGGVTLNTGSTVEYNGAGAQFAAARTFSNLTINNSNGISLLGNVTVNSTLDLASGNLAIGANTLTLGGAVSRTSGNLAGGNTSSLVVNGTAGSLFFASGSTNNYLKAFSIGASGSATLGNALNITAYDGSSSEGVLTVTPGGSLTTGGFLTIKSDANGTARIAAGSTSGGYISGNVTVERYIRQNSNKGWRLLGTNTTGTQTINAAWQEGAVGGMVNPNPGFGTKISKSGGSVATAQTLGFDTVTAGTSLYKYDAATDNLVAVPNTISTVLSSEQGYFLFVRGDRSPGQFGTGAPTTATTLRSTGAVLQGDQSAVSTGAQGWGLVHNPYASRINMLQIVRSGISDAYQVWDPKLGGSFGVGGYQTFTKALSGPNTGNYEVAPGGGSYGGIGTVNNYIESGAAFFIQGSGSAQVVEAAKETGSSNASFRPSSPLSGSERFTFNVYANNSGNFDMVDGGYVDFDNIFSNDVDINDVRKSLNFGENFGIVRNATDLVVERRQLVSANDTVYFKMNQLRQISYRLDMAVSNIDPLITAAELQDKYTGVNTALDLSGAMNSYSFTIEATAASKAADRFKVVFRQSTVVPVSFVSVKAAQAGNNIAVEWKVANQVNVTRYEVEKSSDGRSFSNVGTIVAGNVATYNWLDENVFAGNNYYRIKSVDNNGQVKYTAIVRVAVGKSGAITVSPNPVSGNVIHISFADQKAGAYSVRLINIAGQAVYNRKVEHAGGSSSQIFTLPSGIVSGVYQLEITAPDSSRQVEKLIVNAGN